MKQNRSMMVAGNWKMNGNLEKVSEFKQELQSFSNIDVVLCLPSVFLSAGNGGNFSLGAQNVSQFESGAHTGDLSVSMLAEIGCTHVIVGHSERRQDHGESNIVVAEKAKTVLNSGLCPIFCLGEPLEVRESGDLFDFLSAQIDAALTVCGPDFLHKSVVAYEPIWAIGTGKTASPEQAQEVHKFIREKFSAVDDEAAQKIRILYGGSVNQDNAAELFAQSDIDGGLIGGASLKVESFSSICQAANERK